MSACVCIEGEEDEGFFFITRLHLQSTRPMPAMPRSSHHPPPRPLSHAHNTTKQVEAPAPAAAAPASEPPKVVSTRPLTSFAPRALMRGKGGVGGPTGRLAVAGGAVSKAAVAAAAKAEGGEGGEGAGAAGGGGGGRSQLSNDDFRKMLMKK